MKKRFLALVAFAALLVCTACGGGEAQAEPMTIDEYVAAFQRLTDDVDARIDEITTEPNATPQYDEFFRQAAPFAHDFVSDLDDLRPPTEVADNHDEVVDVFRDLADAWEDGRDGGDDLEVRFHEACTALETAVAAEGVQTELCADPEQL